MIPLSATIPALAVIIAENIWEIDGGMWPILGIADQQINQLFEKYCFDCDQRSFASFSISFMLISQPMYLATSAMSLQFVFAKSNICVFQAVPARFAKVRNLLRIGIFPCPLIVLADIFVIEKVNAANIRNSVKYLNTIQLAMLSLLFLIAPLNAQTKVDAEASSFSKKIFGDLEFKIALSEPQSPKVRYLSFPYRLVLDFDEIDFGELPLDFGQNISGIERVNFGQTLTGGRFVITFEEPYEIKSLVSSRQALDGNTGLHIVLVKADEGRFAKLSKSLAYQGSDIAYEETPVANETKEIPLVVIDPGHGGVDPGAVREDISEKQITMNASRVIANVLLRSDRYKVALTRDKDVFVSLLNRRRLGEHLQADLFLSIHADTVEVGDAQGSTIYLLSESATSENAERFAKFENRVDLFAGEYLEGGISDLTNVLTDLAQIGSREKAENLAKSLQTKWSQGEFARSAKIESAAFAVLKAPEVPSLLLELGYLSNENDRASLQNEEWLEKISAKLLEALDAIFYPNQAHAE